MIFLMNDIRKGLSQTADIAIGASMRNLTRMLSVATLSSNRLSIANLSFSVKSFIIHKTTQTNIAGRVLKIIK